VSSLALPAFLASAAGTALLQTEMMADSMFQKILTGRTVCSCDRHPTMRRQTPFLWSSLLGTVPVLKRIESQSSQDSLTAIQRASF